MPIIVQSPPKLVEPNMMRLLWLKEGANAAKLGMGFVHWSKAAVAYEMTT